MPLAMLQLAGTIPERADLNGSGRHGLEHFNGAITAALCNYHRGAGSHVACLLPNGHVGRKSIATLHACPSIAAIREPSSIIPTSRCQFARAG